MTFEQLYNFTVVAELLNFTKAAETLFISQPTLSRQIATLEQELGAKLFIRDKQKCILTPMGKILLEDSLVLAQNYMKTKKRIQQFASGATGTLSVASMYFSFPELYDAIQHYESDYPNVFIEMHSRDMGLFANDIGSRKADVAFGCSLEMPSLSAEFNSFPLARENFVVLMNKMHPLAESKTLHLDVIKKHRLFFLGHTKFPAVRSIWTRNGFDELINASPFSPDNIHSILLQLKIMPDAMVLLPRSIANQYACDYYIADINCMESEYQILMVWHKDNNSSILRQFVDYIAKEFKDGPCNKLKSET